MTSSSSGQSKRGTRAGRAGGDATAPTDASRKSLAKSGENDRAREGDHSSISRQSDTKARAADLRSGQSLAATIEAEIIPRLLMAHRDAQRTDVCADVLHHASTMLAESQDMDMPPLMAAQRKMKAKRGGADAAAQLDAVDAQTEVAPLENAEFAHLAVSEDFQTLMRVVEKRLSQGMALDTVFLTILAPAARSLGIFWEDDTYSFADVTVGLCRLRQVFEELKLRLPSPPAPAEQFSVVIVQAPGDQHSFGAAIVAHLFAQAGWSVMNECLSDQSDVLRLLRSRHVDLVGISVNTDYGLEELGAFVLKIKRESKNRDLAIILGGSAVAARPDIAKEFGAFAASRESSHVIDQAERIVRRAARRI